MQWVISLQNLTKHSLDVYKVKVSIFLYPVTRVLGPAGHRVMKNNFHEVDSITWRPAFKAIALPGLLRYIQTKNKI